MLIALNAMVAVASGSMPLLATPTKIEASGKLIEVNVGHLAPYMIDFDHDGKKDLLVGTFDGAVLRFYRNVGTDKAPRFDGFTLVQAGGKDAKGEAG